VQFFPFLKMEISQKRPMTAVTAVTIAARRQERLSRLARLPHAKAERCEFAFDTQSLSATLLP
jgi:hypothetical protein